MAEAKISCRSSKHSSQITPCQALQMCLTMKMTSRSRKISLKNNYSS